MSDHCDQTFGGIVYGGKLIVCRLKLLNETSTLRAANCSRLLSPSPSLQVLPPYIAVVMVARKSSVSMSSPLTLVLKFSLTSLRLSCRWNIEIRHSRRIACWCRNLACHQPLHALFTLQRLRVTSHGFAARSSTSL